MINFALSSEEAVAVGILDSLFSSSVAFNFSDANLEEQRNSISNTASTDDEMSTSDTETDEQQQSVREAINKMKSICPRSVSGRLEQKMIQILEDVCIGSVTDVSMKLLMKENFNTLLFSTKEEKEFLFQVEVALKAAVVYYISLTTYIEDEDTSQQVLKEYSAYPAFSQQPVLDEYECRYLLQFRSMMRIALQVVPAKRNKMLIVAICSALEGSGRSYITGGTQSVATSRRMQMFEHESGLQKRRRPERRNVVKKEKPKLMVRCNCGAVILKRTVWKHSQSKKHRLFELYGLQQNLALPINSFNLIQQIVPLNTKPVPTTQQHIKSFLA